MGWSSFRDRASARLARWRRGGRRVWANRERVHVELRALDSDELVELAAALEQELEQIEGVSWARVHRPLRRIIVARDPAVAATDALVAVVERVEQELELADEPFEVGRPERHPGDPQPLRRTLLELGADAWALGMAAATRRVGLKPAPLHIDVAALLSLFENVEAVRKPVERVLGIPATEVALDVASALSRAFLQAELGSAGELLGRGLRLRELHLRRRLWAGWERDLCSEPASFPPLDDDAEDRPGSPPPGAVGAYADKATAASLGAFGLGLASSGSAESAAGALFAGLPKPARLGREGYAAHLGARLARARILTVDPQILRKLDRIDTVVIDDRLADDAAIRATARAAGLRVKRGGDDPRAKVRKQERKGRGVCFVGVGRSRAYAAADCAVGIVGPGDEAPWGADIVCRSPGGAAGVVAGIAGARRASQHGVALAATEAAVGMVLASSGLAEATTRRIMTAATAMSILSMANGVRLAHQVQIAEDAPPVEPVPWHGLEADAVLERLGSTDGGLSSAEAAARRPAAATASPPAALRLARAIWSELANPMTPLLLAGIGLSAVSGSRTDASLIAAVLAANTLFGGVERFQSERAIARLAFGERRAVRVRRGGWTAEIDPDELVPGDVVELAAGELVPADGRLLAAAGLEVDESALTGESLPIAKSIEPCPAPALADRRCMIYEGTSIAAGRAVAVITAAGAETEARRASLASAADRDGDAGVEQRLEALTKLTAPVAGGAGALIAAAAALRGRPVDQVVSAGVSLAVAAVPEGLPLLATISQLAAARRLSARGALVRNPRAVEALGRVDVVCADKTATLTEGRIQLSLVSDGDEAQAPDALGDAHRRVLSIALRASPEPQPGSPLPHLTDRALIEGARRAGVDTEEGLGALAREAELPFEPGRGFHAGVARHAGGRLLSVKGAPERLLPRCTARRRGGRIEPLDEAGRRHLASEATRLARRGLRVLAIGERGGVDDRELDPDGVHGLVFEGFVGLSDPVRPSARASVDALQRAGIATVMVTGDHPSTAEAIAVELGLADGEVVTGPELEALDDAALAERIERVSIFARVTPAQKLRIVGAYRRAGRTVAMTGDGANDAPAIRLADVGIALGARSTDAARAAADLIVTDERIETLVGAVLEGRALWSSVRDAVAILVGGNLGEIGFTLLGGLLDGASPLGARQLLLVNLVTDTLPALAIASSQPRGVAPEELLRAGAQTALGTELERDIAWRAAVTGGAAGLAWGAARLTGSQARARTVGLVALTGTQMAQTLLAGGRSTTVVATGVGSMLAVAGAVQTPGVSHFFGCRPLGPLGWSQALAATAAGAAVSVVAPRVIARRDRRREEVPVRPAVVVAPAEETPAESPAAARRAL